MIVQQSVSLKPYNSFSVDVTARYLVEARHSEEVVEALSLAAKEDWPVLVLGGGSNMLFTRPVEGLVLHMATTGRRILEARDDQVLVEAAAGECWHDWVLWSLEQGLCGLENLSLIPGTVGAAPVQNIGAYGVELKDVIADVVVLERASGEVLTLTAEDCRFAYRDSCFKQEPGRWLILAVRFWLSRQADLHLSYGQLRQVLLAQGVDQPTARQVSEAVCRVRAAKLPDPKVLGNAGSFFKNPQVGAAHYAQLHDDYPQLVAYPLEDGRFKLAAGWLIEQAGWKGYREGDAGVHEHQALVLVNHGTASGRQLLALAERIQADIFRRFGVQLEIEPNVY